MRAIDERALHAAAAAGSTKQTTVYRQVSESTDKGKTRRK